LNRDIEVLRFISVARIGKCRLADIIRTVTTGTDTGEVDSDRLLEVLKALANPTRLQIMGWLRDPVAHFYPQVDPLEEVGVCVKQIQQKAGISQSTASQFMAVLQRAGLVQSRRIGPWTYYRRNDARLAELSELLSSAV
jgi:DNA-binding transcriptional ArsR family regulator